jgi:hypothetical protein
MKYSFLAISTLKNKVETGLEYGGVLQMNSCNTGYYQSIFLILKKKINLIFVVRSTIFCFFSFVSKFVAISLNNFN